MTNRQPSAAGAWYRESGETVIYEQVPQEIYDALLFADSIARLYPRPCRRPFSPARGSDRGGEQAIAVQPFEFGRVHAKRNGSCPSVPIRPVEHWGAKALAGTLQDVNPPCSGTVPCARSCCSSPPSLYQPIFAGFAAGGGAAPHYDVTAVAKIHGGIVDCVGCNLAGADLTNTCVKAHDLTGADFDGANATLMCMSFANFTNASFRGTDLSAANLAGAKMDGADLTGAKTSITSFLGTDLTHDQGPDPGTAQSRVQRQGDQGAGGFEGSSLQLALFFPWELDLTPRDLRSGVLLPHSALGRPASSNTPGRRARPARSIDGSPIARETWLMRQSFNSAGAAPRGGRRWGCRSGGTAPWCRRCRSP